MTKTENVRNQCATAAPSKGSKVVIRGGDQAQINEVKKQLVEAGFVVEFSINKADVVLCIGEPNESVKQAAQRAGVAIWAKDEFFRTLALGNTKASQNLAPLLRDTEAKEAFSIEEDHVRILDIRLPRRHAAHGVEPLSSFAQLCYDAAFLSTARNVALAAFEGIPCMLEGETASSKTTVIRWLGALVGQPVFRLNLNGQTDTSELVGRYVPESAIERLDPRQLQLLLPLLDEGTKTLVELALADGRAFHDLENKLLTARLHIQARQWRFLEGLIPRAMREGAWVILDEINLAEPQVLERLNPVLEDPPSLVLTEGEGQRFGAGGDVEVHNEFRLFGTMNPAEYAGRSVLSPAFRDRWRIWRFVPSPEEGALRSMLRCLVFGEQPDVLVEGVVYRAPKSAPLYGRLQEVADIEEKLERLSVFHASVSSAAGEGNSGARLGRVRRERYIFTRRTLLTVLRLFHDRLSTTESVDALLYDILQRVYLDRIQEESDRTAVQSALRASGLGRD